MIKKITPNVTTYYPDLKTYIEEKSRIDVKGLTKVISDKVELSNDVKDNTQEQVFTAVTPKAETEPVDDAVTKKEGLDTYF